MRLYKQSLYLIGCKVDVNLQFAVRFKIPHILLNASHKTNFSIPRNTHSKEKVFYTCNFSCQIASSLCTKFGPN